ncbi:hypothetical protein ACEQ8H_005140 [Pleosporales sp. CAS-2024a]
MPPLSRHAPKLLHQAGGKRHAGDEDHEEPIAKRRKSPANLQNQKDEDIYAEPASSDDELNVPQPRTARPSITLAAKAHEADELRRPPKKAATKRREIPTPLSPVGELRQPTKTKKRVDDDKENTSTDPPQSSSTSNKSHLWEFGIEHAGQRSNKGKKVTTFSTRNIHAKPPSKTSKEPRISVPKHKRVIDSQANKSKQPKDNESDSEVSMIGLEDSGAAPGLSSQAGSRISQSTPEDKDLRIASRRPRPTILHDQISAWMQDKTPGSSQPASSAPQEEYSALDDYIGQLPTEQAEGSYCPICGAPVKEDMYWEYWKGKKKTVKNQNMFCRSHKIDSAWEEYRSEGYPDIVWTSLPQRIKKYRMDLFRILNNERPSTFRDRYKPIALTGKAAAVPSRRKDLPDHVQQELESYALDDQSAYPGYYGPHGRRLITENVMKILKNEIKNCTDSVVQASGPATFVQAVLVPEAALLLIMEDNGVDREEAEEIREKTYELGMLLNEEIEDEIKTHEQSDDDNEYDIR